MKSMKSWIVTLALASAATLTNAGTTSVQLNMRDLSPKDKKVACEAAPNSNKVIQNVKKACDNNQSSPLAATPPVVASSEPVKVVELVGSSGFCPNGNPRNELLECPLITDTVGTDEEINSENSVFNWYNAWLGTLGVFGVWWLGFLGYRRWKGKWWNNSMITGIIPPVSKNLSSPKNTNILGKVRAWMPKTQKQKDAEKKLEIIEKNKNILGLELATIGMKLEWKENTSGWIISNTTFNKKNFSIMIDADGKIYICDITNETVLYLDVRWNWTDYAWAIELSQIQEAIRKDVFAERLIDLFSDINQEIVAGNYQIAENKLQRLQKMKPQNIDIPLKRLELYTIWGERKDIEGLIDSIYDYPSITLAIREKCMKFRSQIDAKSKVILEPTLEPTHEVIPGPTLDDSISGSSAEVMETILESENIVSETFVPADWADSDDDLPQEEAMEILRQLQEAGIQDIPDDVPGILRTKWGFALKYWEYIKPIISASDDNSVELPSVPMQDEPTDTWVNNQEPVIKDAPSSIWGSSNDTKLFQPQSIVTWVALESNEDPEVPTEDTPMIPEVPVSETIAEASSDSTQKNEASSQWGLSFGWYSYRDPYILSSVKINYFGTEFSWNEYLFSKHINDSTLWSIKNVKNSVDIRIKALLEKSSVPDLRLKNHINTLIKKSTPKRPKMLSAKDVSIQESIQEQNVFVQKNKEHTPNVGEIWNSVIDQYKKRKIIWYNAQIDEAFTSTANEIRGRWLTIELWKDFTVEYRGPLNFVVTNKKTNEVFEKLTGREKVKELIETILR